jgi:TonB family protein
MRQNLRPKSSPTTPLPSPAEVLRPEPDEAGSYTDLAYLAGRFSAHGGDNISPELSADLALEIVLNEIVEQACLATGATGAAIVLMRDGELVCRASSGETAPELGSRLDPSSGISGQCIRTYLTQRCSDALADPRADQEASLRLGIRSVLVMPLLRMDKLLGIFELFSSRPSAFGERDERTLEVLVTQTLVNLDRASHPLTPPSMPLETSADRNDSRTQSGDLGRQREQWGSVQSGSDQAGSDELRTEESRSEESRSEESRSEESMRRVAAMMPSSGSDFLTLTLGAAVLLCAVTLGVLVGRHFGFTRAAHSTPATVSANSTAAKNPSDAAATPIQSPSATGTDTPISDQISLSTAPLKRTDPAPAPGGLQVYENGKEIFHLQPGQSQPGQPQPGQRGTKPRQLLAAQTAPAQIRTVPTRAALTESTQPQTPKPRTTQPAALQPAPVESLHAGAVQSQPRQLSLMPTPIAPATQQNASAAAVNDDPPAQSAAGAPPERVVELSPAEAEDSLLSRVEPEYPDQARQDNVQGDVLLEVRIGTDGTVEGVQLLSGPQPLAQASSDAVRQWRFKPHMLNGQAVKMQTRVTLSFRLPQ